MIPLLILVVIMAALVVVELIHRHDEAYRDAWDTDQWRRRIQHQPHYQGHHRSGQHHAS